MDEIKTVIVEAKRLHQLIQKKLTLAGLNEEHANEVANHLVFADACGIHSHGSVRVDYYAERIAKGGITINPLLRFEQTGVSTGIFHGDNGVGHYVVNHALDTIIQMAKEFGVSVVGISRISHSGTMAYYVKKIAEADLIAISVCQSDPMVVPFGGTENYYGTNPIGFAAPRKNGPPIVFDMATTVQAWGKILDARSKNLNIPETWAVDGEGKPTTDSHAVKGLLPISGPKGYGLMMMVDVLSGILLGLPFGKHVSSMYDKISEGRELGQLFIVIDPKKFTDLDLFKDKIEQTISELHKINPAEGFDQVYYPGEISQLTYENYMSSGIPIESGIHEYLESDIIHYDKYGGKSAFAD